MRPRESVGGAQTHLNLNQGLSFEPLGSDGLKEGQQQTKSLIALHKQASSRKTASFFSRINEQTLLRRTETDCEEREREEKKGLQFGLGS